MSEPRREKLTPDEDAPYRPGDPFFADDAKPAPIRASVDDRRAPPGRLKIHSADIHELHTDLRVYLTLEKALLKDMAEIGEREDRMELEVIERGIDSGNIKVRRAAERLLSRRIRRIERRRQGALDRATRILIAQLKATGDHAEGGADWPPFGAGPSPGPAEGGSTMSLEDARCEAELEQLRRLAYSDAPLQDDAPGDSSGRRSPALDRPAR